MQCLVNTVDESELPSQGVTVFAWSSKKHVVYKIEDLEVDHYTYNSVIYENSI